MKRRLLAAASIPKHPRAPDSAALLAGFQIPSSLCVSRLPLSLALPGFPRQTHPRRTKCGVEWMSAVSLARAARARLVLGRFRFSTEMDTYRLAV
jgi:hypothetical protein